MKKTLFAMLLGALGSMAIAVSVFAATEVFFTPATVVSVRQGQSFTLTIGISPQGIKNYTAKTELRYPADILEVKSFTFASGWSPLSQSGYDLVDNANGIMVKTAGYPGGVSSPVTFGTVSFVAKKSGNGTVSLGGNSFVLDANSQNVLTNMSARTAVVITAPATTQQAISVNTVSTAPTTIPSVASAGEVAVSGESTPPALESVVASQPATSPFLAASVSNILTLGTDNTIIGVTTGIILLVIIGYLLYAFIRRKKRSQF